jgi:hypothetical protein
MIWLKVLGRVLAMIHAVYSLGNGKSARYRTAGLQRLEAVVFVNIAIALALSGLVRFTAILPAVCACPPPGTLCQDRSVHSLGCGFSAGTTRNRSVALSPKLTSLAFAIHPRRNRGAARMRFKLLRNHLIVRSGEKSNTSKAISTFQKTAFGRH